MAMTYRKAKTLLDVGDAVYSVQGGQIVEHCIQEIRSEYIQTDKDNLFYDEVPGMWFLTMRGALDSIRRKD